MKTAKCKTLNWTVEHAKPVRFDTSGFNPLIPMQIRCDNFDLGGLVGENSLGILASADAASAEVLIVLGEYEKVCSSRQLAIHSAYFRRHLSVYPSPRVFYIPPTITMEALNAVLEFIEMGGIEVNICNAGSILSAAARLRVRDLQRRLEQYLRAVSKLSDSFLLQCWEMCRLAPASVQMREEMLVRASERFLYLPDQPGWCQINSNLVRRLFLRPEVKSLSPMVLFDAALTWITGNPNCHLSDVDRVLSAVPFMRMSKIERMQSLSRAAQMQLNSVVQPRIAQAAWHQTCLDFDHPSQTDLPLTEVAPLSIERAIIMSLDDGTNVAGSTLGELFDDGIKGSESGFGTTEFENKPDETVSQPSEASERDRQKKTGINEGESASSQFGSVRTTVTETGSMTTIMKTLPNGRQLKYTDEKIFKKRRG